MLFFFYVKLFLLQYGVVCLMTSDTANILNLFGLDNMVCSLSINNFERWGVMLFHA